MTDNNMVLPVQPLYGNGGGYGGGFGGAWGSDIWLILIVLFALGGFGGWGGMGMGGFGGGFGNMFEFPWLLTGQQQISNNTNDGFRDQMIQTGITSVNDRLANLSTQLCDCCGNISTQLCNGFNGVNMSVNNAQNAIAQQLYGNQIANMQQAYNNQISTLQGFNGVQGQLAQASADNRLGIANLGSDIAREACADRQAVNEGVRDILANQTAGIQRILDKLCDQELQAERRDNANLRSELMYARGQASQIEQTAQIRAGQNAAVSSLVNELRSCPIPAQPVYGNSPIFSCPQTFSPCNNGCGCNNF